MNAHSDGYGLGTRNDPSAPSARSQKHLCGKRTCAGCMVCADPGPRGRCKPCRHDITTVTRGSSEAPRG